MHYFWAAIRYYYATFNGRSSKKAFWYFQLVVCIIALILWLPPFYISLQHAGPFIQQLMTAIQNTQNQSFDLNILLNLLSIPLPWYLSLLNTIGNLFALATLIPTLAISVRRLHDSNHSGSLLWLILLPIIGVLIVIVLLSLDGTPGDNAYGPNPQNSPTGTTKP